MQRGNALLAVHFELIHCPVCSHGGNPQNNLSTQRWVILTRKLLAGFARKLTAFKHAHPGLEAVELFPKFDEAYGVRFAAKGQVPWSVDVNQLAEFMRNTKQPFAIDVLQVSKDFSNASPTPGYRRMSVVLIDGRRMDILVPTEPYHGSDETSARSKAEPGSPANGGQPIRPVTNSTSSAAGSPLSVRAPCTPPAPPRPSANSDR